MNNENIDTFEDDDDAVYALTPKMIAYIALKEAEFIDDYFNETIQMKLFWNVFVNEMEKAGWIKYDEK